MVSRNSRVPPEVAQKLDGRPLAFPIDWTLDQVAEESHRAFLAARWKSEVQAAMAVTFWALEKLVAHKDFTREHWKWIITPSEFNDDGIATRLASIVRPAVGYQHSWRTSRAERAEILREIDRRAAELLDMLRGHFSLRVGLREVVGFRRDAQPLLDHAETLNDRRRLGVQEQLRRGEIGRQDAFLAMLGSRVDLSTEDYLEALRAKLAGKLRPASPSLRIYGEPEDDEEGGEEEDDLGGSELDDLPESVLKEFGLHSASEPEPILETGGDFGSYPARGSALRRAVISATPRAVLYRRSEPLPSVTLAAFIEECCLAWFGDSPSQKDINAQIKETRKKLTEEATAEAARYAEVREIEARALAKLKASGAMSDQLRRFLEDD